MSLRRQLKAIEEENNDQIEGLYSDIQPVYRKSRAALSEYVMQDSEAYSIGSKSVTSNCDENILYE